MLIRKKGIISDIKRSFKDPINPKFFVSVNMTKNKNIQPQLKVNTNKEPLEISIKIPVKIDIVSTPSLVDYLQSKENKGKLIRAIQEQLEREANELIKTSQKKFGDIFGFHLGARKHFTTIDKWNDYNWHEKYKEAKVNVDFHVEIQGYGSFVAPIKEE